MKSPQTLILQRSQASEKARRIDQPYEPCSFSVQEEGARCQFSAVLSRLRKECLPRSIDAQLDHFF